MADPAAPTLAVREPACLVDVEPCDRLRVAIIQVLSSFGSGDAEADYNHDGLVDARDIDAALKQFGPSRR